MLIKVLVATCAVLLTAMTRGAPIPYSRYMQERSKLLDQDTSMRIGGKLVLRPDEKVVSDIFTKEKTRQMEGSRLNRTLYYPSLSFFKAKPHIENTTLYKLFQQMPKGAALHLHDTSVTSLDWVIKNATYRDHVYMCLDKDHYIFFGVYQTPPHNPECTWKSVKTERAAATSVTEFDLELKRNLSMLITDPVEDYANNAMAWVRFGRYFGQIGGLLFYTPVFRDYYRTALEAFYADNVQYIELRCALGGLFDLDGTRHDAEYGLLLIKNVTDEFVKEYPDFTGAKVIMSGSRSASKSVIFGEVKTAMYLNKKYPTFMVGYDLVSDEALYHSLLDYIDALLYPSQQNPPYHLPYFFHAGETEWQGTSVDDNILDALLLNTSRIGHGYALTKHPKLMELVKERQIPVEVNPISNQVLRLVTDLRNHPMTSLMADNFPIVISSDDWAVWEASPMSYDMYMAFMAMSGEDADLTFLKQLAVNSIQYSAMSQTEKATAMKLWEKKWDEFIAKVIQEHVISIY